MKTILLDPYSILTKEQIETFSEALIATSSREKNPSALYKYLYHKIALSQINLPPAGKVFMQLMEVQEW